jgi:alkylglycerol monooxygenase
MNLSLIVLSIPIFFVLIAIEATYDVLAKKGRYRLNDAISNISCGIFEQVTGVFVKVIHVVLYAAIFAWFTQYRTWEVADTWYNMVFMFIAVDFFYYWMHRHAHTVNLFWTGHVVHHQSEEYNLSVALRQGAVQKIWGGFYYFPLALVGFPAEWFLTVGALQTLYQFWIHTEAVEKMGWFGYLFNTPSHHRVHHGVNPKYIDKNHGGTFIIFDRMFGTFQPEEERPTYGVTTPINTFDAVEAHIQPWRNLWSDIKQIPKWSDKFKYLWKPPGWLPAELGGFRAPKEVDKSTYVKFDFEVPKSLNWYLFVQYFFTIGLSAFFLFLNQKMAPVAVYALMAILIVGVMTHGQMFNAKRWAFYIEYVRWLGIVALFVAFTYNTPAFLVVSLATGLLALGSMFWVTAIFRGLPKSST